MADVAVSVVIPTFNVTAQLHGLWASMRTSGLVGRVREIIVVDDGSTDGTAAAAEAFIADVHDPVTRIRLLRLPSNQGRFLARLAGARVAHFEFVLFLDTRLELPANFADRLFTYLPGDRCLQGVTRLDPDRTIFDRYWDRTHLVLFRRYYRDAERGLVITPENYDRYPKGTGVFACPRDVFLAACEPHERAPLLNDDTALLLRIVRTHPIHVRPDFEFFWFPRRTLAGFLGRIWTRGPSSVEYHLFEARGAYFRLFLLVSVALAGQVLFIGFLPRMASWSVFEATVLVVMADVAIVVLTTAWFARGVGDFIVLAPLHLLVVVVAGTSVFWSVAAQLARRGIRRLQTGS
jgi:glycosyltransferase involved in cell wall biosynthesis